jgi:hypothetical protein
MAIYEHLKHFAGLPVEEYDPAKGIAEPAKKVYRVAASGWDGESTIAERLEAFLADPRVGEVPALVIGAWSYEGRSSRGVVTELVQASARLTGLRSLFLGEIVVEEQEISWIVQDDLSPLFPAFPRLRDLWVRGANELRFGTVRHAGLEALAVESGGLPVEVVRDVLGSELPALRHLELWLGADRYGGNVTVADLEPLLSGRLFPRLVSLALRDCPFADRLAAALVESALVRRLRVLDLSLGNLGDEGAQALLRLPKDTGLERLSIAHHYVAPELVEQLRGLPLALDASDAQGPSADEPEDRYIAVTE